MADPDRPDDPEMLEPDRGPPRRAGRADRRREDDEDDDDRDRRPPPRRHYDDDGVEITSDHSMWALFSHLGVFVVGFIAPLAILIAYHKSSPFVARHAKESLNHQISLTLLMFLLLAVAAAIGFGVYAATQEPIAGVIVGYVLFLVTAIGLGVFNLVTLILASIAASKYREYRYPFTVRLIG